MNKNFNSTKFWRRYKYLIPVIFLPIVIGVSFYFRGYLSFFAIACVYGLVPLMEAGYKGLSKNYTPEEEIKERNDIYYDLILYLMVPLQYFVLIVYLWILSNAKLEWYEYIGLSATMGLTCGNLGINVAHELGHRKKKHEIIFAKLLLLTSLYMHFIIQHNRGHHKNVGTHLDPQSARYNENLYTFLIRSIKEEWLQTWEIEAYRIKKLGLNIINPIQNEMLRFQVFQFVFCILIYSFFGLIGLLGFLASAFMGVILLEAINYIQHYGLSRKQLADGTYEKLKVHHSWNSNHELGRIILFELTRHPDHHTHAGRKYQILRHHDHVPQLPAGYMSMIPLAFIPPLWFRIMNPLSIKYQEATHI